jgi:hypothetical protein
VPGSNLGLLDTCCIITDNCQGSTPFFFPWRYSPNLGLGLPPWNSPFHFGFPDLRQSVGLLGRVISSSQGLYLYSNTEKRTHIHNYWTSMPWVGFVPTIPASEGVKTVHALDRSATVTDITPFSPRQFHSKWFPICHLSTVLPAEMQVCPCYYCLVKVICTSNSILSGVGTFTCVYSSYWQRGKVSDRKEHPWRNREVKPNVRYQGASKEGDRRTTLGSILVFTSTTDVESRQRGENVFERTFLEVYNLYFNLGRGAPNLKNHCLRAW